MLDVKLSRTFVSPNYLLEASVIFVWVTTIMPWSVVYAPLEGITAVFIRYPIVEARYVLSTNLPTQIYTPLSGYQLHASASEPIALGYLIWIVGGLLFVAAFIVTVLLFFREERVREATPVPIPRVIGGLLASSGVVLGLATVVLVIRGFGGVPIPIGLLFMLVFGCVLLINPIEEGDTANAEGSEEETATGA